MTVGVVRELNVISKRPYIFESFIFHEYGNMLMLRALILCTYTVVTQRRGNLDQSRISFTVENTRLLHNILCVYDAL